MIKNHGELCGNFVGTARLENFHLQFSIFGQAENFRNLDEMFVM
jgi:hypothetical protein